MARDMSFDHLELAYEALANAIDKAGPANEALFLTKLVILLTHRAGDLDVFSEALKTAMRDLPLK